MIIIININNRNFKSVILYSILSILTISIFNLRYSSDTSMYINMKSDKDGILQIFYDDGSGFSEKNSISVNVNKSDTYNLYKIDIPEGEYIDFRLDPIDKEDSNIYINKIFLINNNDNIDIFNNLNKVNGISILDKGHDMIHIHTDSNDPIISISNLKLKSNISLYFNFKLVFFEIILIFIFYYLYKINNKKVYITLLFILSVFLLFMFRNIDPFINPIIYTEDGKWIDEIINNGFFSTLWNARSDYFVFGNIILLYIAYILNFIFFGYNLSYLPHFISFISYLFYSVCISYIYFSLFNTIKNKLSRILLLTLLICIPLGDSSSEIFGKISNIGYIIPVILTLSILNFEYNIINYKIFFIITFFAITTNPVCYPIMYSYIFIKILLFHKYKKLNFNNTDLVKIFIIFLFCLFFTIIIAYRYLNFESSVPLHNDKIIYKNLLEGIFARSIFYPFIFPIYNYMNDITIIILSVLLFCVSFFTIIEMTKKERIYVLSVGFTLIIYILLSFIMRPGLTSWISEYKATFPDRYFLGQNILAIIYITFIVDFILIYLVKFKLFSKLFIVFMLSTYISNIGYIFEFNSPRLLIKTDLTFKEQMTQCYMDNMNLKNYNIPIYFEGWNMNLPRKYVHSTVLCNN